MALKKIDTHGSSKWWENAYPLNDDIHVQYELTHGRDLIRTGDKIRIKNQRAIYTFRCLAHNIVLDETWIDCIDPVNGGWFSFSLDKLKGIVKPKRSRAKKPVTHESENPTVV